MLRDGGANAIVGCFLRLLGLIVLKDGVLLIDKDVGISVKSSEDEDEEEGMDHVGGMVEAVVGGCCMIEK